MILDQGQVSQLLKEIEDEPEIQRKLQAQKRQEIYKGGGKRFLIDQLLAEFGQDSLKEMRICPINLLRKIVNKRSTIYNKPPQRTCELPSDQALLDYYVLEMDFDVQMQKANRYFNLHSNTAIYIRPDGDCLAMDVIAPSLYSKKPNALDQTKTDVWIFSSFDTLDESLKYDNVPSATGQNGVMTNRPYGSPQAALASDQRTTRDPNKTYIFWTPQEHFTTNSSGLKIKFGPDDTGLNPIGMSPVIDLSKDKDGLAWAYEGDDTIDLIQLINLGWSDMMTIAKHQGFSIMAVWSEEPPTKMTVGTNKILWLPMKPGGSKPEVNYVQASPPLDSYKSALMELLALLLTTNDMNPKEVGGTGSARSFTSGFQALIETADTYEARRSDEPALMCAEKEAWEIIKAWHNYLYEINALEPEARSLGTFSDDFEPSIRFAPPAAIESDQEKLTVIKMAREENLISQKDAIKMWRPDMNDEQVDGKLNEIQNESKAAMQAFGLDQPTDNKDNTSQDGTQTSQV